MRTKGGRSNYSPVKQMISVHHHQPKTSFQDEFPRIELQNNENHQFQSENRSNRSQNAVTEMEDIDRMPAEEVYICDCCGVTRQLSPAIEFMATFRSLFFLFNLLAFVFGIGNLGWIMLFGGLLTCLVALVGFMGATKQAVGLLLVYLTSMVALTLAFVASLVLLAVYGLGSTLQHFLTKEIYEQIRRRSMNSEPDSFNSNDAAQFLDFIQVKMRCCGAADFRDYAKLGMVVPTTCYTIDKNYILAPGCGRAIRDLFDLRAGLAIGISSASILTQLITITLATLMFCSIYHWRANARPVTPTISRIGSPASVYHQRPRSRTPIVI